MGVAERPLAQRTNLDGAARLVDKRFGPVLELFSQRFGGDEPAWFLSSARMARHPIGAMFNNSVLTSAGTSLDPDEAAARALGEALERYSGVNAQTQFEIASLRDGGLAGRWPICAPDEPCSEAFRYPPSDEALTQVRMRRLGDDASVLAPAGFVCLGFHPLPPEPPVTIPISTGLAFHPEQHQAIWRGLCEVIERDAVMSAWWLHKPLPEMDMETAPYSVRARLDRLAARRMTARMYDLTTELGVPTAFCVLTSDRFPNLVVGAATRSSAERACAKALDEVVSLRIALQVNAAAPLPEAPVGAPSTLVQHALWHANGNRDCAFDFLLHSGLARSPYQAFACGSFAEPKSMTELAGIAARPEMEGLSVLWADLTAPEMREFGTVARVVVPELVPMSPDDRVRWLATPRLLDRAKVSSASRANFASQPHPFS